VSEENLEIVRRSIDAFNRGGLEEALRFLDHEIEWTTTSAFLQAGTYQGHEGVRQFLRRATGTWDDLHVEPEELIDASDQVVVPLRITARGKQSGSPSVIRLVVLASLQDGVIVRIRSYTNTAGALKAAGVSEDTSA
jgi:ketosteroid isomerase-like protein